LLFAVLLRPRSAALRCGLCPVPFGEQDVVDDRVIGLAPEEWIDYLFAKWGMAEIVMDASREAEMSEVEREFRQRGYDIMTDRAPGTLVRQAAVRIDIPVTPSDTLQVIVGNRNEVSPSIGLDPCISQWKRSPCPIDDRYSSDFSRTGTVFLGDEDRFR